MEVHLDERYYGFKQLPRRSVKRIDRYQLGLNRFNGAGDTGVTLSNSLHEPPTKGVVCRQVFSRPPRRPRLSAKKQLTALAPVCTSVVDADHSAVVNDVSCVVFHFKECQ